MTPHMLANRYTIQDEIGSGGMGTVFRASDSQTGATVAIKQLKSQIARAENIERFKREGEALRELNHPNIVKMLDAVEHDEHHYLIMEYVTGGDLKGLIEANGTLDVQQCVNMSIDLADALTRAHRLHIIHRDLKPANVLIAADGTLRLTDFGVAHIGSKHRVTDTDAVVGTVDYLPPEALNDGKYDERGDIWAFGVMLFEMLSGQRPFGGESLATTITQILTDPIPDLESLAPQAPTPLVDLIYRMLQRDPDSRIRSVRHIGATLEDILHGRDSVLQIARLETSTTEAVHRGHHNLPAQTTPFVGREAELAELANLLKTPDLRLITVLAPGGMGKTRLSLEAASQALLDLGGSLFYDGAFFVELAPLTNPENIVSAVADAVGYQFQTDDRTPTRQLFDYLHHKHLLLVMDNFEHLIDGAGIVGDILNHAPGVQILASSRQRLNQPGETLFHLSGLDFPDWETPEDALNYAAVKLFLNSARRVRPDFDLTATDLDPVARICRLVQGMPLGIVLAASWLGMLSPAEVAAEIGESLEFLATDEGELPERQRSINAVMGYSWQQMTEAEQQVFMRLSVFRGGFTREAAQAVSNATLRHLMSLVNKSLLRRDVKSGRYNVHELLRQFAYEKLEEAGESNAVGSAHSQHYLTFLADLEPLWLTGEQLATLKTVEQESANLQQAIDHAIKHQEHDALIAALESLVMFHSMLNTSREGAAIFQRFEDSLYDADKAQQPLGYWQARIRRLFLQQFHVHPGTLREAIDDATKHLEAHGTQRDLAFNLVTATFTHLWLGDFDTAVSVAERGRAVSKPIDYTWGQSSSWANLAWIAHMRGDTREAIRIQHQVLELAHSVGSPPAWLSLAYLNLGEFHHTINESAEAKAYFEQSLEYATMVNNRRVKGHALKNLGNIAHFESHYDQAIDFGERALEHMEAIGDKRGLADVKVRLGDALRYIGRVPESVQHLQDAVNLYEAVGDKAGLGDALILLSDAMPRKNLKDDAESEALVRRSLEVRRELGNPMWIIDSLRILAVVVALHPDGHDEALALIDEADKLADENDINDPGTRDSLMGFRVGIYNLIGKAQAAYDLIEPLLGRMQQEAQPWAQIQILGTHGITCVLLDRYDEARQYLTQSMQIAVDYDAIESNLVGTLGSVRLLFELGHQLRAVSYLHGVIGDSGVQGHVRLTLKTIDSDAMLEALSSTELEQAKRDAQTLDLESIVHKLLAEFSDS